MKKNYLLLISMCLLSLWLGATIAVDFFAIPAVFRNITNLSEAGAVGMSVFGNFNKLELLLALASLASFALRGNVSQSRVVLISLIVLVILAASYLFYLTPELTAITLAKNNSFEELERAGLEQQLQFMHTLYVRLDSFKMLLILLLLGLMAKRNHIDLAQAKKEER